MTQGRNANLYAHVYRCQKLLTGNFKGGIWKYWNAKNEMPETVSKGERKNKKKKPKVSQNSNFLLLPIVKGGAKHQHEKGIVRSIFAFRQPWEGVSTQKWKRNYKNYCMLKQRIFFF